MPRGGVGVSPWEPALVIGACGDRCVMHARRVGRAIWHVRAETGVAVGVTAPRVTRRRSGLLVLRLVLPTLAELRAAAWLKAGAL